MTVIHLKHTILTEFTENYFDAISKKIDIYIITVCQNHLKEYPNSVGFYYKGVYYNTSDKYMVHHKAFTDPLNENQFPLIELYLSERSKLANLNRAVSQYVAMLIHTNDTEQTARNKLHDKLIKYIPKLNSIPRTEPFIIESTYMKEYFKKILKDLDHFETYLLI